MKRVWMAVGVAFLVSQLVGTRGVRADAGLIGGAEVGGAIPVSKFRDRVHTGGTLSPFLGYMFTDVVGLVGQAQFIGFPGKDRPDGTGGGSTLALGFHAGPRLALPFTLLGTQIEPYGTFQPGVFTGLQSDTAISRTSWGYSTGGGINFRLSDAWLLGAFGRYNWLDQHVTPGKNVEFFTAGLGLTYNLEKAPPPPPPVAAAPPPRPAPRASKKIVLRGVHFDFDKAVIRADARPVLNEAIATLKSEGGIAIIAEGNTDSVGSDAYNLKLSERRAAAVRDYLVNGGISAKRIQIVGYGESRPVASNDTEDGRAQNRRVELRIRGD